MPKVRPVFERLIEKIDTSGEGCWEWQASRHIAGYGWLRVDGKTLTAHRLAYETFVGPVGEMHVLHRCDNPPCCRPSHLFLGTNLDNIRDAQAKGRYDPGKTQREKTECPQGHPYDSVNTYVTSDSKRMCRTCSRDRMRARRAR